jgi:hypothetical protein
MKQHRMLQLLPSLLCVALVSACLPKGAAAPTNSPEPVLPSATVEAPTLVPSQTPAPTDTALPPTPSPTPAYDVLSPTRIHAGDYTFDVTVEVRANELFFLVHSEFPVSIEKSYPDGNVPAPAKAVDVRLRDLPNTLKVVGGGGGGGGEENGMTERSQGTSFRIEPILKVGDKVHVSALVTFDDSIGILQPVPFEYDLVVKKAVNP